MLNRGRVKIISADLFTVFMNFPAKNLCVAFFFLIEKVLAMQSGMVFFSVENESCGMLECPLLFEVSSVLQCSIDKIRLLSQLSVCLSFPLRYLGLGYIFQCSFFFFFFSFLLSLQDHPIGKRGKGRKTSTRLTKISRTDDRALLCHKDSFSSLPVQESSNEGCPES